MNIMLRQALVQDPASAYHLQRVDILIKNGVIAAIANNLEASQADQEITFANLSVSPGWVDIFANFCDPGFEFKETLQTGSAAAAAGGFTEVFALPNTAPALHNRAAVEYIVQGSKSLPVSVHPIGAVTKNLEGKELAEMYDMRNSGAIAFGDGTASIQSGGILLKALQYLKAIGGVLVQLPDDKSISAHGLMNESVISTRLGLAGKPAIAEEIMISRDIELVRYTDSRIHFTGVSSAKSLALIRNAKAEGLQVTCSVTPFHLFFTEEDLQTYDTNLKVAPPLRTKEDRDALRTGVLDGTVDCIASHHQPHEKDSKIVEFEYARNGMTSLETAFSVVCTALPQIPEVRLVELFALQPRAIFGLPQLKIKAGQPACLSLFSKQESWMVNGKHLQSKSRNTPFADTTLSGKVYGIINKDQLFLNK